MNIYKVQVTIFLERDKLMNVRLSHNTATKAHMVPLKRIYNCQGQPSRTHISLKAEVGRAFSMASQSDRRAQVSQLSLNNCLGLPKHNSSNLSCLSHHTLGCICLPHRMTKNGVGKRSEGDDRQTLGPSPVICQQVNRKEKESVGCSVVCDSL